MSETIPVIDIARLSRRSARRAPAAARQVHDALTTVGFFVLTGHDVPLPLIERTFAEARRFHAIADGEEARAQAQRAQSTATW